MLFTHWKLIGNRFLENFSGQCPFRGDYGAYRAKYARFPILDYLKNLRYPQTAFSDSRIYTQSIKFVAYSKDLLEKNLQTSKLIDFTVDITQNQSK